MAVVVKGMKNSSEIKNKIYQTSSINDIILILNMYKKEMGE